MPSTRKLRRKAAASRSEFLMRFEASMIVRDKQRIKNHPGDALGTSGPHLFRLSATMVELSLRHTQFDSPADIPASFPTKAQCYSAEAEHHSGLQASRELLPICNSRISDYGVKIYSWLKTRMGLLAACSAAILLTLLVFSVV